MINNSSGLIFDKLFDKLPCVKTNVSTLLREFPKIRRAAMAGETVIVQTREGNLRITADRSEETTLLGSLRGKVKLLDDLSTPTSTMEEWKASL